MRPRAAGSASLQPLAIAPKATFIPTIGISRNSLTSEELWHVKSSVPPRAGGKPCRVRQKVLVNHARNCLAGRLIYTRDVNHSHSREGGNLENLETTGFETMDSRLRGNDVLVIGRDDFQC
jgi:hypothetical protein